MRSAESRREGKEAELQTSINYIDQVVSSSNRGVVPHPTRNRNRPSSPTVVRQPSTTSRGAPSPSPSFPNASIEQVPHRPSRQKSSFTSIAPHDSASASTFVTPISPRPTRSSPVPASTNVTVTRGVAASPPDPASSSNDALRRESRRARDLRDVIFIDAPPPTTTARDDGMRFAV